MKTFVLVALLVAVVAAGPGPREECQPMKACIVAAMPPETVKRTLLELMDMDVRGAETPPPKKKPPQTVEDLVEDLLARENPKKKKKPPPQELARRKGSGGPKGPKVCKHLAKLNDAQKEQVKTCLSDAGAPADCFPDNCPAPKTAARRMLREILELLD